MPAKIRILCVGADQALLGTRCAVLVSSGYDAWCALYSEAESLLGTEHYDLIIVSAFLTDEEKNQIVAFAGTMPTIVLRGLTLAPELLRQIEGRLNGGSLKSNQETGE